MNHPTVPPAPFWVPIMLAVFALGMAVGLITMRLAIMAEVARLRALGGGESA